MDVSRAYWMMLPFWEVPSILGSGMLLGSWAWFFIEKKKGILLATVCVFTILLVIYVRGGRNGWMAMDSVG